jgi:hypothetical protein
MEGSNYDILQLDVDGKQLRLQLTVGRLGLMAYMSNILGNEY